MNPETSINDKFQSLEVLLSHLQHDVDKLHEALLLQRKEIDDLRQSIARLAASIEEGPPAPRNLLEERPPHY